MRTALGLYDYGARFYSTKLGRFLSSDPLVAGVGALTGNLASRYPSSARGASSPQSLDRFSYVLNNPLRYTDPTGRCFTDPFTGKRLHCSPREAFEWAACAHSAASCKAVARNRGMDTSKYKDSFWSDVSRLARYGIGTREFKDSYAKHLSCVSGQDIEHYANPTGETPELMFAYYNTLWQYGFISDEKGTGLLYDIPGWLGDRAGAIVGSSGCVAAGINAMITCRVTPAYCEIAMNIMASECIGIAAPAPQAPPSGKVLA